MSTPARFLCGAKRQSRLLAIEPNGVSPSAKLRIIDEDSISWEANNPSATNKFTYTLISLHSILPPAGP